MPVAYDAVLLLGFGGPTEPGRSVEFIRRVAGPRGTEDRILEVAKHYDELGGISPYNRRTEELRAALQARLSELGIRLPVEAGMRFWEPFIPRVVARLAAEGRRRVLGLILAPYQSAASWDSYQQAVAEAAHGLGAPGFEIDYLPPYHLSDGFLQAAAENIRTAGLAQLGATRYAEAVLVFTAHSIPEPSARGTPYASQYGATAAALAERLEKPTYCLSYQSAAGGRTQWLGPDVSDAIRQASAAGAREVIVTPTGLLCDHVEVLYDLDRVARSAAAECGLGFVRPRTVESHPKFVDELARRLAERIDSPVRPEPGLAEPGVEGQR